MGWQQDYSKCICEPLGPLDPPPGGGRNTNDGSLEGVCGFLPVGTTAGTGGTFPPDPTGWSGFTHGGTITSNGDIVEPWWDWRHGGGGQPPGPAAPGPPMSIPPGGGGSPTGPITGGGGPSAVPPTGGGGPTTGGGGPSAVPPTGGGGPTTGGGGPSAVPPTGGGGPTTGGGGPSAVPPTGGGGPTTGGGGPSAVPPVPPTGATGASGPITGGGGPSINTITRSSNLPGHIVYHNPFTSMATNVDMPLPQTNTAVPRSLQQIVNDAEIRIPDANRNYAVVDPAYTMIVDTNPEILSLANIKGKSRAGDKNNIFGDSYNLTLADALEGRGGNFTIPYNGVTVAAILQGGSLIQNSLSTATVTQLDELATFNIVSLNIKEMYINALSQAVIDGTVSDYSPTFFKQIAELSKGKWPIGIPQSNTPSGKLNSAYALAFSKRKSLLPKSYSSGDRQRTIQRYRLLPTDIDLCIPVKVRDGRHTGIRFKDDDTIPIVTRVGVESIIQQNEFLSVATRDATPRKLELASRRSEAYYLENSDESIIQSLVGNSLYSIDMTVSSTTEAGSVSSVEFSGIPSTLPEAILFSSMRETITDVQSINTKLRATSVKYKPAWNSSSESTVDPINITTSAYSGPRISIVIPSDDPIWNYLLENNVVELHFNDFNVPLGGGVMVRKILTDFMIFPTNKMEYSSLKGKSRITNFTAGTAPTRTISLALSPRPQNQIGYVTHTLNPSLETASGEKDSNAMMFTNSLHGGGPSSQLSKYGTLLSSSKSTAAGLLDLITSINTNYNLENGSKGKRIPIGDLTSLMSLSTYLKVLTRNPPSLIYDIFNGVYNDIKVFTVLFTDKEKTFLTAGRLKGSSLEGQKIQTNTLSDGRYFDSKYNRKIYRE